MDLLRAVENSGFGIWVRESGSVWSYPIIIFLHAVGLTFVAGVNAAMDLRLLGFAPRLPVTFRRMTTARALPRDVSVVDVNAGTVLRHVREGAVMRASFSWMLAAAIAWSGATAMAGGQRTTDTSPSLLRPSLTGSDNFNAYCAPCHGRTGTGDGPVAQALTTRPAI